MPATMLWAALDCPALWALIVAAAADTDVRVVTGQLEAARLRPVRFGEPYSVVAWPAGGGARKRLAVAALCDGRGEVAAVMRQTCVEVTGWGVPLAPGMCRPAAS